MIRFLLRRWTTLVLTVISFAAGPSLAAQVEIPRSGGVALHVSPGGNDEWTGRLAVPHPDRSDGPLATISQCQTMVRELLDTSEHPGPITVTIHGTHQLEQPLVFTPRDSGTSEVLDLTGRLKVVRHGKEQAAPSRSNSLTGSRPRAR